MKTLKRFLGLILMCYLSINTLSAQPFQVSLASTDPTCGLQDGSIITTVVGGTGPFTFAWYDYVTDQPIATTQDLTGLGVGRYFLSVTDAGGNTVYASAKLSNGITATHTITPATCQLSDGTATLSITGGTAPYTILWEDGQTTLTATGLAPGSYDVDITDANGCVANLDTFYVYIYSDYTFNATYTPVSATCSNPNGSATVDVTGGVAPYSYYWNTVPVQTGQTATNLATGSYSVVVTDATGCAQTIHPFISASSGTLQATATVTNATCGASDGSISVNAVGGTAPYTYVWGDASTASSLTGLAQGWYHVTISDNGGCSFVLHKQVESVSPISVAVNTTQASCNHTSGSISATPSGGVAPYTYTWGWSNAGTTATLSNVADGYYYVQVSDANGCKGYGWGYVPIDPNCINTISGTVFQDANANCIFDAGEYPIVNASVSNSITPGNYCYSGRTDQQGDYTFSSSLGNYSVTASNSYPHHSLACPSGGSHLINGTAGPQAFTNVDFGLQPIATVNDVRIVYGSADEARPGFQHYNFIYFQNIGTSPASGTMVIQHDVNEQFLFASSMATGYDPATREVTFSYSNLGIGESVWVYLYMQVPPTTALGTVLITNVTLAHVAGDDQPADNLHQITTTVVGSFDPNDIAVSPQGVGPQGFITRQDAELTYHIRFQNTGTAEAYFIKVVDTLDTDLDPLSVHDVVASHAYTLTITNGRVLEFYFPDIHLPDSTTDLEGSNGFITYKVNQANTLPMGTEITNRAFIYFDFNAPVETNTVLNTITTTASVTDPAATAQLHKAYPVPTSDQLIIASEVDFEAVQVMDITGRVVKSSTTGGNTFETSVRDLAPGVYFYKLYLKDAAPMTGKIVVE